MDVPIWRTSSKISKVKRKTALRFGGLFFLLISKIWDIIAKLSSINVLILNGERSVCDS